MTVHGRRFALYWAPPVDHPLWRAGCEWLGRDAETGAVDAESRPHRAGPRRAGFHATLKPPFALRRDANPSWLVDAVARLAADTLSFEMPALGVGVLGDFVALRPRDADAVGRTHPLRRLADDGVRRLDPMRRPATPAELAAAMAPGLLACQRTNVERWGDPHVLDAWRFHLTLTDPLPAGEAGDALRRSLAHEAYQHFARALTHPVRVDSVALFVEDAPGADLRLERRFEFAR